MSHHEEEPRIAGREFVHVDKSRVKFIRNARGETQVEVSVVEGTTVAEMAAIRQLAFDNYKAAVEQTGGLLG